MRRTASILITLVLILMALGLVMLASATQGKIPDRPWYFVQRQCIWMVIALCGGIVITRLDYRFWKRLAGVLVIASLILLALVFVPPLARKRLAHFTAVARLGASASTSSLNNACTLLE